MSTYQGPSIHRSLGYAHPKFRVTLVFTKVQGLCPMPIGRFFLGAKHVLQTNVRDQIVIYHLHQQTFPFYKPFRRLAQRLEHGQTPTTSAGFPPRSCPALKVVLDFMESFTSRPGACDELFMSYTNSVFCTYGVHNIYIYMYTYEQHISAGVIIHVYVYIYIYICVCVCVCMHAHIHMPVALQTNL